MTEAKQSGTSTDETVEQTAATTEETENQAETLNTDALASEQSENGESNDSHVQHDDIQQLLTAKVQELEVQVSELENRNLRLQADFDNFKRRSRAEREDLVQFATSKLIQSLLPVLDNLDLALVSGKNASDVASVVKGVDMVARQLGGVLEQEGLTALQVIGELFDPNLHEGVMQVEATEEYPAGTVVEELRKGYSLKGKVIRPAMVKISQ